MNFHAVSAVNHIRNWSRWNSPRKLFSFMSAEYIISFITQLQETLEQPRRKGIMDEDTGSQHQLFFSVWVTLRWFKVSMTLDIQDDPSLSVLTKKLLSFCLNSMKFAGEVELKETNRQEEEGKRDQQNLSCLNSPAPTTTLLSLACADVIRI